MLGRKNWLFANTASGAKTSAILYSLAETANNCHLRPDTYLTAVLDRMKEIDDPGNHPEVIRKKSGNCCLTAASSNITCMTEERRLL